MSAQPIDVPEVMDSGDFEPFAAVPEWLIDAKIGHGAFRLFVRLIRYAGKGGTAWPSRKTLSDHFGCSVDTVDRWLRELQEFGLITVTKRPLGNGWTSNVYRLTDPRRGSRSDAPTEAWGSRKSAAQGSRKDAARVAARMPTEREPLNESQSERESSSSSLRSSKPTQSQRQDVEQVCQRLAERMIENACKPPTVDKRWRDAARLMLDKDGRPLEQVLALIDWCQSDEFWRGNVMSVPKLREKYDMLRLRMQAEQRGNVHRGPWQGGKLTQATTDACRAGRMRVNL